MMLCVLGDRAYHDGKVILKFHNEQVIPAQFIGKSSISAATGWDRAFPGMECARPEEWLTEVLYVPAAHPEIDRKQPAWDAPET